MLNVDECGGSTLLLGLGHNVKGKGSFTRRFGTVNLNDTATGHAAYTQGVVKGNRACGHSGHVHLGVLAHFYNSSFAIALFKLADGGGKGFFLILRCLLCGVYCLFLIRRFCHNIYNPFNTLSNIFSHLYYITKAIEYQ